MTSCHTRRATESVPWKILTPHRKGCSALRQVANKHWLTAWSYLGRVEYRDAIGRRRKGYSGARWWHTRCNDADCPAEIVINETWLLGQVDDTE